MKRFDPVTGDLPQSVIYQLQYQQLLKAQVEGVLDKMNTNQFLTVSDYLELCYEDGFIGTIFDLHGQGVPIVTPIDQESMVRAVQLDSKISEGLYTRMGQDVDVLKERITSEVSRAIATGATYAQTAKLLANQTRIGYNKAVRITRTEGHRIQNTATMDACYLAEERGARVVKQWDATLDGKTRPSHRKVDGEFRELDESFSNGLAFPGDPDGGAAEVVNCRCDLLQRARWAVDGGFTKWNNFTQQIETFDSPQDYDKFKKSFFSDENVRFMNYAQKMQDKYGTKDWTKIIDLMTDREYKHYSKLLANNPVYKVKTPNPKVTSGTFPDDFRKNAQGKKVTKVLADALNDRDDLNPSIHKLFTSMDKLPRLPWDRKVSFTGKDHALDSWVSRRTGETTRCVLKVPKMEGVDLTGQKGTAFHEITHYIDMGVGDKKKLMSQNHKGLTKVVKATDSSIGPDVQRLFDDFADQYNQTKTAIQSKYKQQRNQVTRDYMDGIIPYDEYKKRFKALTREEDAERDYQARNLCGGGVTMLSDIYDALSGGAYQDSGVLLYGHGGQYYSREHKRNSEILANYMSLSVIRPDLVDLLRMDKPDLCDALDDLIEEMVGEIS